MGVDELAANPTYIALEPPPEKTYASIIAALIDINKWAAARGYAVSKKRVNKNKNKTRIKKVWFACDRGGKAISTVNIIIAQRPNIGSKKTDCPFMIILKETAGKDDNNIVNGETWQTIVENSRHNYDPTLKPVAHAVYRRLQKIPVYKATVKAQKHAGMQANHIYSSFYGESTESLITKRDIYNERANVRREDLGGLALIHALLRFVLSTNEVKKEFISAFECENGVAGGPLKYLFVMHDKHIKLLKANSEVLIADATYKTNSFNMPLLNIVGMASNNMSFFAASVFLSGEADVNFKWAFQHLKGVYDAHEIRYPKVFLINRDLAQSGAIAEVFLNAVNLFCI
jgi:hypothetical protein